ncbi:uncharacterized protein AB675_6226 [Cyphellophora attinorum]|uniref:Trichothecene 3-O-acetyltransferase n=1 Tax=Cyphellophora attinorum TaxID=1664694 RepID=A0A0N1HYS9_9EURO|nr:uncharacterized protein AB675_6226 [Phialophora attinorum]KPI43716.1 hypothetical protein AB675_6226 [Phialophora attinorum]
MSAVCEPIARPRLSNDSTAPSLLGSTTTPSTTSSSLSESPSRRYSTGSIPFDPLPSANGNGFFMTKYMELSNGDPPVPNGAGTGKAEGDSGEHLDIIVGKPYAMGLSEGINGHNSDPQRTNSLNGEKRHAAKATSTLKGDSDSKYVHKEHVIQLSSIEHCMPRAYIRVCLAYPLPDNTDMTLLVTRLNQFTRKVVDAKPYLAGHVVPAPNSESQPGLAEIHFTDHDFIAGHPSVKLEHISEADIPYDYKELNEMKLPPSLIRPEIVSALPEGISDGKAPVFRLQANVVKGGLIVSTYLHHCISDGTGMGLIITGSVLHDDFTFDRHLESKGFDTLGLNRRLSEFANQQTIVRRDLSWSFPNQISDRLFHHRRPTTSHSTRPKSDGRGCIFTFPKDRLLALWQELRTTAEAGDFISENDVLQALLWHHMTKARSRSPHLDRVSHSRLFTPVNIRSKLNRPLPDAYFGAAVDFALTELPMAHLCDITASNRLPALARTASAIRQAIGRVDEPYIRQAIALARDPDPNVDVRDLMGSSMNRTSGADMYITSWQKLGLYEATLDLGLGRPDWVRKPWSKDPGSCIVLPNDDRKQVTEVLVQMTVDDMDRLMQDQEFSAFAPTWVE